VETWLKSVAEMYSYFDLPPNFQNISSVCLAAYSRAIGSHVPGLMQSGREADVSPTPCVRINP